MAHLRYDPASGHLVYGEGDHLVWCKICPDCASKISDIIPALSGDVGDPDTFRWGKICECIAETNRLLVEGVDTSNIWAALNGYRGPNYRVTIEDDVNGEYCLAFYGGDPGVPSRGMGFIGRRCTTVNTYWADDTLRSSGPGEIGLELRVFPDLAGFDPAVGGVVNIKATINMGLVWADMPAGLPLLWNGVGGTNDPVTIGTVTVPAGSPAVNLRNGFCSSLSWSFALANALLDYNWNDANGYPHDSGPYGAYGVYGKGGTITAIGGCAKFTPACFPGCPTDTQTHCITPYINTVASGIGESTVWSGWVAQPQVRKTFAELGHPVGKVTTYREGGVCKAIKYVDDGVVAEGTPCPPSTPPAPLDGKTYCELPRYVCAKLWESRYLFGSGWTDPAPVAGAGSFCVDTTALGVVINGWGPVQGNCSRYFYEYLGACNGTGDTASCAGLTGSATPPAKPTGDPGCAADDNEDDCPACYSITCMDGFFDGLTFNCQKISETLWQHSGGSSATSAYITKKTDGTWELRLDSPVAGPCVQIFTNASTDDCPPTSGWVLDTLGEECGFTASTISVTEGCEEDI